TVPAPGVYHLHAAPQDGSGFSTYSTLVVRSGESPASRPLQMPIVLKPYQHENEQFGHLPDFPTDNQPYFDLQNRPFVRTADGIAALRDGRWTTVKIGPPTSSKIAFDKQNTIYVLTASGLAYSSDNAQTFATCPIPRREGRSTAFDLEEFTGHNVLDGPPPVLRYTETARDEKLLWRRIYDLELFLPHKVNGQVVLGEPVLITRQCIGLASHSGIPSSVVSKGNKVHVVWGEATDPSVKLPGLPAYVATYDRETKRLSRPTLIGYGAPPNDIHNSPSITMDKHGFLHVLGGTHGWPFPYASSLKPNDAASGWTEAVPAAPDARQTYIGMVCGPDGTLHSAFRLWLRAVEPFPAASYGALAYQRKRAGQSWEAPRVLVVPPFSEYSVYYHRLTIDRKGRLFLSYDYWSTHWFYRNDHLGRRRTTLMSADGGTTWKLLETKDLLR
ncbi:MAG: BNR repeat-containing protein, partial [Verrucomicrobiae bacterium]|nr:BNR repeat-containing protein [Verrucomicrobiae bacterium]